MIETVESWNEIKETWKAGNGMKYKEKRKEREGKVER